MGDGAFDLENAIVADEERKGELEIEDAAVGILPIREIVRRFISRREEWHEKKPDVYHASDVWYCLRKQVYKYATETVGTEPPFGVFESGRRAEDAIYEALKAFYGDEWIRRGLPIEIKRAGYILVGKSDPAKLGPGMQVVVLYEVKSVARGGLDYTSGEHHKRQLAIYSVELKSQRAILVHPGRSDYLDLGQHSLTQDEVKFYYASAMEYFDKLHAAVTTFRTSQTLPGPEPYHDWECRYCPFLLQCRQDGGWVRTATAKGEVWKLTK